MLLLLLLVLLLFEYFFPYIFFMCLCVGAWVGGCVCGGHLQPYVLLFFYSGVAPIGTRLGIYNLIFTMKREGPSISPPWGNARALDNKEYGNILAFLYTPRGTV